MRKVRMRKIRTTTLRTAALVLAWLALPPAQAQTPAEPLLPSAQAMAQVFRRTPAWQAATLGRQAEQAGLRQGQAGAQEWVVSASLQRWRQGDLAQPAQWQEWEIGIDRPIRLPGKRPLAEAAGQARVAQAEAGLQRAWREFGRQYLQHWATWQRESAAAQVSEDLVALLQRQAQAVATRQRLGDAARIETAQAQAALAQAQAQAQAARARATQARTTLDTLFAGWADGLAPLPATGLPTGGATDALAGQDAAAWQAAQLAHSAELALARQEASVLRAQAAVDQAERRPDPSVGLRLGSSRGGAERMVGVVLSMPIGGGYRDAGAAATALRAAAAEQQADELARQLRAEGLQRLAERDIADAVAQRQQEAASRLTSVADTLARGFSLGEGSLGDVLAARRLAHEQALVAAASEVERQHARLRLLLEAGQLWGDWRGPEAAPPQAAAAAPTARP